MYVAIFDRSEVEEVMAELVKVVTNEKIAIIENLAHLLKIIRDRNQGENILVIADPVYTNRKYSNLLEDLNAISFDKEGISWIWYSSNPAERGIDLSAIVEKFNSEVKPSIKIVETIEGMIR